MARPRSDDKRNAILQAATRVFAERGLAAAPTSAISKAAGIAEGTLFTYFASKDALMNDLYCELKSQIAEQLLRDFPVREDARGKIGHIWTHFVRWGVANPAERKVLAQLTLTDTISVQSRQAGMRPFAELETLALDSIASGVLRDYPVQFIATMMSAMAEATMTFIGLDPDNAELHIRNGFTIFWTGIAT